MPPRATCGLLSCGSAIEMPGNQSGCPRLRQAEFSSSPPRRSNGFGMLAAMLPKARAPDDARRTPICQRVLHFLANISVGCCDLVATCEGRDSPDGKGSVRCDHLW